MRKLTDSDKQEILKLYRESAETTSTLAERYEVSNSTISRLLKSTLPEDEYEYLVSLKRAARTPGGRAQVNYENIPAFANQEPEEKVKPEPIRAKPSRLSNHSSLSQLNKSDANLHINEKDFSSETRRIRRRSSAVETIDCSNEQLEILEPETIEVKDFPNQLSDDEDEHFKTQVIAEMLGEELLEDDEDDEDDELEVNAPILRRRFSGNTLVQVLPLSSANLPRICYIVIDRSAELITKPLKEFADLGQIPTMETLEKTLPIFDNHRVAKRFSTKRDRVIKVPDSRMLQKTRYHLNAKGITRLLIDGQIYSLA